RTDGNLFPMPLNPPPYLLDAISEREIAARQRACRICVSLRGRKGAFAMLSRILVIDDAASVHGLVRARLAEEPYDIRCANNAESGETVIREFAPDLILLDIDMPGENGLEFCKRLKDNPATARIPVIFLTAADATEQKVAGLELGAVDYVTKPFEPAELKARVRASLRTKRLIDTLSRKRVSDFMREAVAEAR